MKIIDYDLNSFESLGKGNWGEYLVTAELDNGEMKEGVCQGDTHIWALETFQEI